MADRIVTVTLSITVKATTNEWDAPLALYRFNDGLSMWRRDDLEPDRDYVSRTVYPHAVIFIDGMMSEFDTMRQPEGFMETPTWQT